MASECYRPFIGARLGRWIALQDVTVMCLIVWLKKLLLVPDKLYEGVACAG